jgi:hypothetical protein
VSGRRRRDADTEIRIIGPLAEAEALVERVLQVADIGRVDGPYPSRSGDRVRFYLSRVTPRPGASGEETAPGS